MKKTLTVLIAAAALIGAAGCSAPQLSSEETCARINSVAAGQPASSDKYGTIRFANQIRPIAASSSDELKAPLQDILAYLDESTRDNPDAATLAELQARYAAAGQTYTAVCSQ
ncbi:hypothetical protein [Arthrobacter sp. PAMC25284]|uniref:hypothetical protein n=1 Tax=Arthrobacter sp. PAMC25284 TaxID=2861279 RepID=UPI001C625BCA|nr:hypothetical protein [Arthrobacter sp. PAMC25284]QYF89805.1 hypothetical protein KY499_17640 [Arthrobacter sp. PAMC25284]